jgi:hypothetical protein
MQRIYQQDVNWFGFSFNLSKFQKGWIDEYDFHDNVTHSPHPLTPLNDGNIRSIRDLIQLVQETSFFVSFSLYDGIAWCLHDDKQKAPSV